MTTVRADNTRTTRDGRPARRISWRPRARNALLTAHIVFSVGLLGDSAGFLAVAIRRAGEDGAARETTNDLLNMFALVFGIPLSFLALLTGLLLGVGTRWGVFRYPWVVAKLILIVSVILVGALVLNEPLDDSASSSAPLIVGSAYDVVALTAATGLGVFKPGRAWRRRRD
jgi:hypothetical protein